MKMTTHELLNQYPDEIVQISSKPLSGTTPSRVAYIITTKNLGEIVSTKSMADVIALFIRAKKEWEPCEPS